ncbi:MAG: (2Fe-2S)-binding protein [Methylobacter sp.]
MYICLCFDVSKSELKKAIREGHDSIEKLSEPFRSAVIAGAVLGMSRKF